MRRSTARILNRTTVVPSSTDAGAVSQPLDATASPNTSGLAASATPVTRDQTLSDAPGVRSFGHRVPGATFRLQLHAGFTFQDAEALVPYLHALGITHCYCSSYLQAVPGSPHGYDVADPSALNAEIGSEGDYRAFVTALRAHGMSQVLDVVPNHMGIARSRNRFWQDVLENGPSSRYARVFDIDWSPVKLELAGKVLLPILGDSYGAVLERQEIRLDHEDGAFCLRYFETTLPVAPRSYPRILRHRVDTLVAGLGEEHPDAQELLSIITSLEHLPARTQQDPERLAERQREKEIAKRRLGRLVASNESVARFIDDNVKQFNGTPGDPRSFDLLDGLLGDQAYRLSHWRVASEEINYRRFFDINELAAVRMDNPEVFDEAHRLVFALLADGSLSGLRVDHIDGLYDPGDYLRHLQARARDLGLGEGSTPLYLVVEKILAHDEPLPADWPVDGTTGYEFANAVNGLLVDGRNVRAFDEIYVRFTGERASFADLAYRAKKLIMQVGMASEINALAHQLNIFSERNRHYRDFTLNSLAHAIREIIAAFPVYRTYVPAGAAPVSDRDRHYIEMAVAEAKRRNPAATGLVLDFIRDLLLKEADYIPEEERDDYARFVTKFQQTTSPVTAKGVEDTALYVYNRLVSLNEVGGDPSRFGVSPSELHAWLEERGRRWPSALSATSTHDTKRSEDVRARISVLSEMPGAWKATLSRCSRAARRHQETVNGLAAPDRNEEYLLYQTLVGAWPLEALGRAPDDAFVDRICAYMVKAMREAKRHTSWLNPSPAWEDAVTRFVRKNLDARLGGAFMTAIRPLVTRVAHAGMWNSLAQVLLKITAPGVPDLYQGTETWDFSLVDPDNRRPVDYDARRALLTRVSGPLDTSVLDDIVRHRVDGRLKMLVTTRALALRASLGDLFARAPYIPLEAIGSRAGHVFAFARTLDGITVLTAVTRLSTAIVSDPADVPAGDGPWSDTRLVVPAEWAKASWTDALTGRTVRPEPDGTLRVADVLAVLPVATLRS